MRSLFLWCHFTKHLPLTHLYLHNTALKNERESLGLAPSPTAAPRAGNTQGQGVSVTASRPGDKGVGKQEWGGLCCQPATGLGINNMLIPLPDPVAIPIVPHTHAAEDAPAHLMSRVRPDSALGAAGRGLGKIWGTRGHLQVPSCQHIAPSSPPPHSEHPPPAI